MKTIKEQAEAYYQEWRKSTTDNDLIKFFEHIITEERKRRLPTKEEFTSKCADFKDRDTSYFQDFKDIYDWLLSYDSEAVVEDEVKGEECSHIYSRAMGQPYPRLCVKCGKPESVKVEDITQPSEDYQAKYSEAMVIIKRQAGDLQLLRENNIELKQELSHEKTLGNSARSDMEEAQKEAEYWKERCKALDKRILEGASVGIYSTIEPLNRNELAEKMMIRNSNVFFEIEDYRCDDLAHGCFQLADEFIKQAKQLNF